MSATNTSIRAYAHVTGTQTQQYGAYLMQRTIDMRLTTDREASKALNTPCGQISARRWELIEQKYFAHGVYWMPALMPNKYDAVTGNTVQSWAMVVFTGEDMPTMKAKTVEFITKLKLWTMEKELKIGTKVLLTGWNISPIYGPEDIKSIKDGFEREFPVDCTITSKNIVGFIVLFGYSLSHFTYETLPDETPQLPWFRTMGLQPDIPATKPERAFFIRAIYHHFNHYFFKMSNEKEVKAFAVTGTFHGSIIYAKNEGDARRIFHKQWKGESIIHIKESNSYFLIWKNQMQKKLVKFRLRRSRWNW
jgi:hypothetical protein